MIIIMMIRVMIMMKTSLKSSILTSDTKIKEIVKKIFEVCTNIVFLSAGSI